MPDSAILYISHDPMCSFCWAFRPSWEIIQSQVTTFNHPKIKIVYLLGGLAPDSDEPMPAAMRQKLSNTWKYIEEKIPGTKFNHDFWEIQSPRRSTYPACRAVYAAKMIAAKLADEMTHAIQRAYYLQAQNPSDESTLINCALSIGLDKTQFIKAFQSEECHSGFEQEMTLSRQLGISSFPSIVITKGQSRYNIPIDYNQAKMVIQNIEQTSKLL